jgi:hypothetical protein
VHGCFAIAAVCVAIRVTHSKGLSRDDGLFDAVCLRRGRSEVYRDARGVRGRKERRASGWCAAPGNRVFGDVHMGWFLRVL